MGCNSYYPCDDGGPSFHHQKLQRSAKLLLYVREKTGQKPEAWAVKEADNCYASDERSVTELCATLKAMDPKQRDALVYNARNKNSRDLADWWEEHQAADVEREREEAAERDRKKTSKKALAKLSKKEQKALGL